MKASLEAIGSGLFRSLKSWKGGIIAWLFSLITVSFIAFPLRKVLINGFGDSMATSDFYDGFDPEIFSSLGTQLDSILSFLSAGTIFFILAGFVVNAFLTGGLFDSVGKGSGRFSCPEFFRAGAKYFGSFLTITFFMSIVMIFLVAVITGLSAIIIESSQNISEKSAFLIYLTGALVFVLIVMPILILITDYARAGIASNYTASVFKALGFGICLTFSKFWPSYTMILILFIIQFLFFSLASRIIPYLRPVSTGGILTLFLLSQVFFCTRIFLRILRYASVTSLMEKHSEKQIKGDIIT